MVVVEAGAFVLGLPDIGRLCGGLRGCAVVWPCSVDLGLLEVALVVLAGARVVLTKVVAVAVGALVVAAAEAEVVGPAVGGSKVRAFSLLVPFK